MQSSGGCELESSERVKQHTLSTHRPLTACSDLVMSLVRSMSNLKRKESKREPASLSLSVGRSFLASPSCKTYRRHADSVSRACSSCRGALAVHAAAPPVSRQRQESLFHSLVTAYCALRNARVVISIESSLLRDGTVAECLYELKKAIKIIGGIQRVEAMDAAVEAGLILDDIDPAVPAERLRYVDLIRIARKLTFRVRFICALDDFYYKLYYCADLNWRTKNSTLACPIPAPHEHFSVQISDEDAMNTQLQSFMIKNFSSEFVHQYLQRVWGMNSSEGGRHFESNPLLKLHFCRWRESICLLSKMSASTGGMSRSENDLRNACRLPSLPGHGAPTHATLKVKGDPLIPPHTRMWNDSCRTWACHLYAYATPSPEAISKLLSLRPVLEIGAGTGYWASLIRSQAEAEDSGSSFSAANSVLAYDKDPPSTARSTKTNSYHGRARAWTSLSRGGPAEAIAGAKAAFASPFSLFLCYPPPDSDMALQALRQYAAAGGKTVCYVGEYKGDTGTKSFQKLLEGSYSCVEVVPLPNWCDTCYSLSVWKAPAKPTPSPSNLPSSSVISIFEHNMAWRCSVCGTFGGNGVHLYRCRVTYALTFCGSECASKGRRTHLDELAFRYLLCSENGHSNISLRTDNGSDTLAVTRDTPVHDCDHGRSSDGTTKRRKRKRLRQYLDNSAKSHEEKKLTNLAETESDLVKSSSMCHPVFDISSQWYMTIA